MASQNSIRIRRVTDIPFQRLKKKDQKRIVRLWLVMYIGFVLPIQELERCEFIQFCRSYSDKRDWLNQVSEFESRYRPDEIIQWYTHPSGFPSRMINTVCRTQNPALISKIRYFLKHMHEQLAALYFESLVWMPNFVTVYRGQRVSPRDFKHLVRNREKKMFITTPLSTTSSREVAAIFSGGDNFRNNQSENVISVIFKITIRTQTARSKPFAYIQEYSHVKGEKEIILSIGMILSFVDIRKLDVNSYEISLIHDRNEEEVEKELMHTAIESCSHQKEITVNDFLTSMNIHITLSDDFYRRPLTSLLDEGEVNIIDEGSTLVPFSNEENPTSYATHDHLVIWLDYHNEKYDASNDLKHVLLNAIDTTTDRLSEVHEINKAIRFSAVFSPVTDQLFAVTTMEKCLELIDKYYHRKIFLITSGTLGAMFVPYLRKQYPSIENIYVFCTDIRLHMDWASDFTDNLLMFNFHNDLFARVVYDIGMYYLQQGMILRGSDDHHRALFYFYSANKLVMRANFMFQPYFPFSLKNIQELIINEEARLPRNIIQSIRNSLSYQ